MYSKGGESEIQGNFEITVFVGEMAAARDSDSSTKIFIDNNVSGNTTGNNILGQRAQERTSCPKLFQC